LVAVSMIYRRAREAAQGYDHDGGQQDSDDDLQ
jgi:hypothetical protein